MDEYRKWSDETRITPTIFIKLSNGGALVGVQSLDGEYFQVKIVNFILEILSLK